MMTTAREVESEITLALSEFGASCSLSVATNAQTQNGDPITVFEWEDSGQKFSMVILAGDVTNP